VGVRKVKKEGIKEAEENSTADHAKYRAL
jgi:hypothetical protein